MTDLRVDLAGVELKNPIVVASGTYGFGHEYGQFYDLSELGAICVKGLTPVRRDGNPPPRGSFCGLTGGEKWCTMLRRGGGIVGAEYEAGGGGGYRRGPGHL